MNQMNLNNLLDDFLKVCELAKIQLTKNEIVVKVLNAGSEHIPPKLPKGYMAVYIFNNSIGKDCYKVGKVGSKSNPRYQIHHYNVNNNIKSSLAKSIINDNDFNSIAEVKNDVGNWIKQNTSRINLLLKVEKGMLTLNLLEAFCHCRLKPKYEGFKSLQ